MPCLTNNDKIITVNFSHYNVTGDRIFHGKIGTVFTDYVSVMAQASETQQ